jgi:hypothetical protein
MSDWVGDPTNTDAVVELLAGLTSLVLGAILDAFVIVVPDAVPAGTVTTSGNWTVAPEAIVAVLEHLVPAPFFGQQLIGPLEPTAGSVRQIHPVGMPRESKVVPVGTLPVKTAAPAVDADGPALFTVWVKVMVCPARTGFGDAVLESIRSNWPAVATVTTAVELLLFGSESAVVEVVLAVFLILVPEAVPEATVTIRVNVVLVPEGNGFSVHWTAVVGVGQVHAAPVCVKLEKVVPVGIGSLNTAFAAAVGPLFVTTIV